jgi:hypothetical protein
MNNFKISLLFICIIGLVFGSAMAGPNSEKGDPNNELFSDADHLSDAFYMKQAPEKQDKTIVQIRYVKVNFEYLEEAESIVLNLFNDVSVTAVRERVERRSKSRYSWFGRVDGMEHSSVVLTIEDGNMAGNITIDGKIYQVRPAGDGIHSIREIDQSGFPPEAPPIPVEVPVEEQDAQTFAPPAPKFDDGSIIDVMVVYTDDVAAASPNILSEIQLAIDETNTSYANSGINQRLRLIDTVEVNYAETGNMSADLNCITSQTDGCLDSVHTWRDDSGADEVSFWVENGGAYCGIAWLMTTVSGSFESNAFSVVDRQCATGYYTFGHELGHNMGAHHDRYVTSGQGAYPYSYGYVYTPDRWRTIMAYNRQCTDWGFNCTRIQYWSNPDVNFNGVPTGVPEGQPDSADNRKTLNNTALTVANFRQSAMVSFIDVPPGYWAEDAIYKIYNAGITTGCSQNPLRYCPQDTVSRTQMAVFLGRAVHGSSFTPPPATGIFADVTVTYWAADWIEQFYNDGITSGCGQNPLRYCPENPVTRAQMAIFLLRAKHGSSYTPPPATGIFADVPVTYWAADWIEQLYQEGITTGCSQSPLRYCPENSVTRAQMAVFLVRTFGL